ncbi:hypothetical protein [Streptomyces sp. NPDC006551]|uniref:hypothetical protein n=1 Tax=Streptomyces sp. NPDC006551 TaxID=3157178 RepID=UPI0033ADD4E7
MRIGSEAAVGIFILAAGAALMVAGAAWKGRAVRPLSPKRARAVAERASARALLRAADAAIASAREAVTPGEPAIVTVEDVVRVARDHYGQVDVERPRAAAALRRQYERGACAADCMTDAYG